MKKRCGWFQREARSRAHETDIEVRPLQESPARKRAARGMQHLKKVLLERDLRVDANRKL